MAKIKDIKAVFFDFDGVLFDSKEGIVESAKKALIKNGIDPMDEIPIGPPLHATFENMYGLKGDLLQKVSKDYHDIYSEEGYKKHKPYLGINSLCFDLWDKYGLPYIVSFKKPDDMRKILKLAPLAIHKDVIFGKEDGGKTMDKSDVLWGAIDTLKIKPEEAVMIGDSPLDIMAAKKVGTKSIGVLYGYSTEEQIKGANPDFVAKSVGELKRILT